MRRTVLVALLLLALSAGQSHHAQTVAGNTDGGEAAQKRLALLTDLQALSDEAAKLEKPIARALAKAEVADAAWSLDRDWAKKLLREAYELTFPGEDERAALRDRPAGGTLTKWTDAEQAQRVVRSRVLAVANRDAAFAGQLAQLTAKQLGVTEEHLTYATLASRAVAAGDKEAAGRYILQAIDADPTLINASVGILDLAAEDRAAADKLILQYIERLRASQALVTGRSAFRVYFILKELVFPSFNLNTKRTRVAPAGPHVVKAYVYYMAESMSRLEQSEPGATRNVREFVLSTWPLAQAHAPELASTLLELEKLSRRPGDDAAALQASEAERNRAGYEKRVKSTLDGGPPDEMTINMAIGRGDFTAARKMIDRLEDGPQKTRLTERVNAREALSFASKGDTVEAEKLARQLRDAVSILQVYPALIDKCAASKDQSCIITLVYQAMKQLKQADGEDAVALSLSRLAKSVARVNAPLALEVLDEVVSAANRSNTDTGQGRVGFEADVFRVLTPKGEGRVHQSATTLKDRLSRIVALASIYQSKAGEFAKRT